MEVYGENAGLGKTVGPSPLFPYVSCSALQYVTGWSVILILGALNAQMSVSESICMNTKLTADVDIQMTENHKRMQMKYVTTHFSS